jgi:hypothetical protein
MNRWQHFYDLAATQLAASFAATRNLDPAEKAAMAKRYANEAKAFADAFKAVEEAAFDPEAAEREATVRLRSQLGLSPDVKYGLGGRVYEPTPAVIAEPLGEASRTAALVVGDD